MASTWTQLELARELPYHENQISMLMADPAWPILLVPLLCSEDGKPRRERRGFPPLMLRNMLATGNALDSLQVSQILLPHQCPSCQTPSLVCAIGSTALHLKQAPPLRAGLGPVAVAVTGPGELGFVARYR